MLGLWIVGFCLLLNIFPSNVYEWLKINSPLVSGWCNTIKNDFTVVQSVALYLLFGSGMLLIWLTSFQYSFISIEKIRRHILWINIPLYAIGFSCFSISLILLFVNLL
ncbi:MAG: hypothetical protein RRZ34_00430 [Malacoplasma sp.]